MRALRTNTTCVANAVDDLPSPFQSQTRFHKSINLSVSTFPTSIARGLSGVVAGGSPDTSPSRAHREGAPLIPPSHPRGSPPRPVLTGLSAKEMSAAPGGESCLCACVAIRVTTRGDWRSKADTVEGVRGGGYVCRRDSSSVVVSTSSVGISATRSKETAIATDVVGETRTSGSSLSARDKVKEKRQRRVLSQTLSNAAAEEVDMGSLALGIFPKTFWNTIGNVEPTLEGGVTSGRDGVTGSQRQGMVLAMEEMKRKFSRLNGDGIFAIAPHFEELLRVLLGRTGDPDFKIVSIAAGVR